MEPWISRATSTSYDRLLDETLALGRPYPTKPIAPVVDVHDER